MLNTRYKDLTSTRLSRFITKLYMVPEELNLRLPYESMSHRVVANHAGRWLGPASQSLLLDGLGQKNPNHDSL